MSSVIVVHPDFDAIWPFTANHFYKILQKQGPVALIRLDPFDERILSEIITEPAQITRLVVLRVDVTPDCLSQLTNLREAVFIPGLAAELAQQASAQGITLYNHVSESLWAQSVAEYALALTLCGLRRIPQLHHQMLTDLSVWDYRPAAGYQRSGPGPHSRQFGDNPDFTNGTVAGKRVRIIGIGNIGSRYARLTHVLGADVVAWDPYAGEPSFHLSGARREWFLKNLVEDAEIFAPMLPLRESTRGLVTEELIQLLPKGCLVILVTRAGICDMKALRSRILRDELSLAADVFDVEPLPLTDPLLGRHNVVHVPHNAGRTIAANETWAEMLAGMFTH